MRISSIWLGVSLGTCLLGGCSGSQTPTDETADAAAEAASPADGAAEESAAANAFEGGDLVGTWVGPCFPSPAGDGSFNQLTFRMTEADWDLDYVAHGDEACSGAAKFMTVNIKGPYALGDASDAAEGARQGVFSFTTKTVTAHQDGAVAFLKEACGMETLEVGKAADLNGGCAKLGAYPVADCGADYDIVKLDGATLHFGKRPADNNMCAEDKRPTTFEGGAAVTRQ